MEWCISESQTYILVYYCNDTTLQHHENLCRKLILIMLCVMKSKTIKMRVNGTKQVHIRHTGCLLSTYHTALVQLHSVAQPAAVGALLLDRVTPLLLQYKQSHNTSHNLHLNSQQRNSLKSHVVNTSAHLPSTDTALFQHRFHRHRQRRCRSSPFHQPATHKMCNLAKYKYITQKTNMTTEYNHNSRALVQHKCLLMSHYTIVSHGKHRNSICTLRGQTTPFTFPLITFYFW